MPPAAVPLAFPAGGPSIQLINGRGLIKGWSWRETAGAVATLRVRDGSGTGGLIISTISLAASESTRDWLGENGILFVIGVFVEIVAGTVEGSVWVVPEVRFGEGVFAAGPE